MMNKNKMLFFMLSLSLFGCDSIQQTDDRNIEARTMIIGGVPVHDKDYTLPDQPHVRSEAQVNVGR